MTRRPIGHKVEPDGSDPITPIATFLYREDAKAAGEAHPGGYLVRIQYSGAWMRWCVTLARKSWGYERWMNADGSLGERW